MSDRADQLLAPPEALGVLDRVVNRVAAVSGDDLAGGTLVLAGADHPVVRHGVSAYEQRVTSDVMRAAIDGASLGAAHARAAGLGVVVIDAGVGLDGDAPVSGAEAARPVEARGDISTSDALTASDVERLLDHGRDVGTRAAKAGLVALGEVGVGNTTVAAAMTAALLGLAPDVVVGLGSGADAATVERKRAVVASGLARLPERSAMDSFEPQVSSRVTREVLRVVGGAEVALLAGVVLGAASGGAPVVLDGLATSVAALAAARIEPSVQAYLVAGQRSREAAHGLVLDALGLEPLLDLRLRAGEGVGASLASGLVLSTLAARRTSVRTQ